MIPDSKVFSCAPAGKNCAVTVWLSESKFFQDTVSPTLMSTLSGLKSLSIRMTTSLTGLDHATTAIAITAAPSTVGRVFIRHLLLGGVLCTTAEGAGYGRGYSLSFGASRGSFLIQRLASASTWTRFSPPPRIF